MKIILIGAQGSGKGTQADLLSQAFGVRHIATGDLFRKALQEQTKFGLLAQVYTDRGELVPDEITVASYCVTHSYKALTGLWLFHDA